MIKIALAGNPNSGKTTLFNALTGANQFVGNWPGLHDHGEGACNHSQHAVLGIDHHMEVEIDALKYPDD